MKKHNLVYPCQLITSKADMLTKPVFSSFIVVDPLMKATKNHIFRPLVVSSQAGSVKKKTENLVLIHEIGVG